MWRVREEFISSFISSLLNLLCCLFLYITPFLVTAGTYTKANTLMLPWCATCISVENNKKVNTSENQKAEPWPNTVFGGCWLKIYNEIFITKKNPKLSTHRLLNKTKSSLHKNMSTSGAGQFSRPVQLQDFQDVAWFFWWKNNAIIF